MRYYAVNITQSDGTPYFFKSLSTQGNLALTSLLPSGPQSPLTGLTNPAALQVEFDLSILQASDPDSNSWFRVWGLGLQDLSSASNLNGLSIEISGGMAQGLPLANPQQAGVLLRGQIYQAFGNWIGVDQTLDMFFIAGGFPTGAPTVTSPPDPSNFSFIWPAGSSLATAIGNTLSVAMPGKTQSFAISPNLVTNTTQTGQYSSFQAFGDAMKDLSRGILGGNYLGVQIANDGTTISVYDGTAPTSGASVIAISFQDLIGQPTWSSPLTVSVKTVLRSDIHAGDIVSLPPSAVTTTQQALTRFQDHTSFSGMFFVQQVHHYGHSRQPDAASWCTVFQIANIPGGG